MKLELETTRRVRIEMIPLIDTVFLLLVYFIYAMLSMAVHRGLPVELPESSSVQIEKKLILSVTVKSDGSIYLDKQPVSLPQLTHALQAKPPGELKTGVLLFADRELSYQKLFQVLDRIKQAGVRNISLQAEAGP